MYGWLFVPRCTALSSNSVVINNLFVLFFSGFINGTVVIHDNVAVGAMMFAAGCLFLVGVIIDIALLYKVFCVPLVTCST